MTRLRVLFKNEVSSSVSVTLSTVIDMPLPWALQRYPQRRDSTEEYGVPFSRVVYIERDDFREEDAKDFYGLAPGKSVMLR